MNGLLIIVIPLIVIIICIVQCFQKRSTTPGIQTKTEIRVSPEVSSPPSSEFVNISLD